MVDLHCHILPGLDDGPATMEQAVEFGRAAEAAGVRTVAATPHIRDGHPFPLALLGERRQELKRVLGEAGVQLEVVNGGGEVAVSKVTQLDDPTLAGLGHGHGHGHGPYLLVESPTHRPLRCSRPCSSTSSCAASDRCWRIRSAPRPSCATSAAGGAVG